MRSCASRSSSTCLTWEASSASSETSSGPEGALVLSTLNRTWKSYALAIVAAEYVLGWLPRGTHDWQRFVTPEELERHLAAAGFGAPQFSGLVYDVMHDEWKQQLAGFFLFNGTLLQSTVGVGSTRKGRAMIRSSSHRFTVRRAQRWRRS